MSTYGDLKAQIQRNLGNREDPDTDALILTHFNHCQRVLAYAKVWRELEALATPSLIVNQREYTFAALGLERFYKHFSVKLVTASRHHPVGYLAPSQWDTLVEPYLPTAGSGKPTHFTLWGTSFLFGPKKPDSAYQLRIKYYQRPADVTAASDSVAFEDADLVLVAFTTAFCWYSLEELETAASWFSRATTLAQGLAIVLTSEVGVKKAPSAERIPSDYWKDPFVKEVR